MGFVGLTSLSGCEEQDTSNLGFRLTDGPAIQGEFVTRIADMFDGTSRMSHHVVIDDGRDDVELWFEGRPDIEPKSIVRVTGDYVAGKDRTFEVDDFEIVTPPPQPLIDAEPYDPRRIAFVLIGFGNGNGLTPHSARTKVFLGPESTNVYYGEISYGKEAMTGDVFGPYDINDPGGCNTQTMAYSAQQAMKQEGVVLENYRQFMYHFPRRSDCSWSGLANTGTPDNPAEGSWYNGSSGCVVLAQELGHNYGMIHSHTYTCHDIDGNEVSYSDECESNAGGCGDSDPCSEYGDPFDPMGGGCAHMNVVQKGIMGWLEECNVVTARSNGTFNLVPTELPCNGTQALRFPVGNRYYYLEYRRPFGEFDTSAGVLVHVAPGTMNPYDDPYLLDMTPDSRNSGDHLDAFLKAGDEYVDYMDRVTFRVTEENDRHAVIEVEFPGGGSGDDPTCEGGAAPVMEAGAWGTLECADTPILQDTEPPEVVITYPENNAYFDVGSDFVLTADATDNRQIIDVTLFVDGEEFFSDIEEPFEWSISNIPEGMYGFQAVADDGTQWNPSEITWVYVGIDPPEEETGDGATGTGDTGDDGSDDTGDAGDDSGDDSGDGSGSGGGATEDGGCGCRQSGTNGPMGLALTVLGFALVRRRRQR